MIVMDTCTVLWDALEPKQLSKKGRVPIATRAANFVNLFLQSRN